MLKTTRSSEKLVLKAFRADNDEVVRGGGGKADKTMRNSSKSKKSKNEKSEVQTCIGATGKHILLNSSSKKVFNQLRQAFIKALIF